MRFELNGLRARRLMMRVCLGLLAATMNGECVLAKPLRVRQVCGEVVHEKGFPWPSTLRLTKRNKGDAAKVSEQLIKTDDEGQFAFQDIPAGEYELRVAPAGMREVFVPVLVDLRSPQRSDTCTRPMDLKIAFLPETCVSPELRKGPR